MPALKRMVCGADTHTLPSLPPPPGEPATPSTRNRTRDPCARGPAPHGTISAEEWAGRIRRRMAVRTRPPPALLRQAARRRKAGVRGGGSGDPGVGGLTGGLGQPHHCTGPPGPSNEAGPTGMARVTAPSRQSSMQRAQDGALLLGTKPPPAPQSTRASHTAPTRPRARVGREAL